MNKLSPIGVPAVPTGSRARCPTGEAGAPNLSTLCPGCDGPFSYRITDEDTGCRYPVDDGEHYCEACDTLWTDAELIESPAPRNLPTMEQVQAQIAEAFGLHTQAMQSREAY